MKYLQTLIALGFFAASHLQAAESLSILVMFSSDLEKTSTAPPTPDVMDQLERVAGTPLTWSGATRTNAQILKIAGDPDLDTAQKMAMALGQANGVLWAELLLPQHPTGHQQLQPLNVEKSAAEVSDGESVVQFVIKLRAAGLPNPETLERMSDLAGIRMTAISRNASGSWLYQLAHPVSMRLANHIEQVLETIPSVLYADPVSIESGDSAVAPNDPDFEKMWFLHDTTAYPGSANVQAAWSQTTGSSNVTVAVIDTGILFRPTHPDLAHRLTYLNSAKTQIAGWDMISEHWRARDGDGRDPNPRDEGNWETQTDIKTHSDCGVVHDSVWHGSHVAGTIAASSNNQIGITGVDWSARILPVRVMGACGGTNLDIDEGIYWAAGKSDVPGTKTNPYPANVINMSLGGSKLCADSRQEAINFALSRGAIVVVSSGNGKHEADRRSPANCHGVITVSAVDTRGDLAHYSNFSSNGVVTISAPGGDKRAADPGEILSTISKSLTKPAAGKMDYGFMQGTSVATPVVSGIVSLMLSVDIHHHLTPQIVKTILQQTARPFPNGTRCAEGGDVAGKCGAGIVDASAAITAVKDLQ